MQSGSRVYSGAPVRSGKEDGAAGRVDGHFRLCAAKCGSSTDAQLGLLDLLPLCSLLRVDNLAHPPPYLSQLFPRTPHARYRTSPLPATQRRSAEGQPATAIEERPGDVAILSCRCGGADCETRGDEAKGDRGEGRSRRREIAAKGDHGEGRSRRREIAAKEIATEIRRQCLPLPLAATACRLPLAACCLPLAA